MRLFKLSLAAGIALTSAAAHAQTGVVGDVGRGVQQPELPGDWQVTLGAGALLTPEYSGADTYDVSPIPFLDIRYRDLAFLSSREGLGVNAYQDDAWRVGPLLRWDFGRDQDDADALDGMGDVDGTLELGAFVYYTIQPVTLGLEARQALDGHEGFLVDLSATWAGRLGPQTFFTLGPRLTYASEDYMQSYYGVSQDQSARSGYDRFDAGAGLRDIGLVGSLTWVFRPSWALTGFAESSRLLGDAADSPLVDAAGDPNQLFVGAALTYRFGF